MEQFLQENGQDVRIQVRKNQCGGIVNPDGLDDHLEEMLDAERSDEPAALRRNVNHGLNSLKDPDSLIQNGFRVGDVVSARKTQSREMGLEEQVSLRVR